MSKEIKEQPLPKWFTGELYTEGGLETNPFTGDSAVLSPAELSMYDFIIGCNYIMEIMKVPEKTVGEFHKGLTWFRRANPEAYMILLD
tara:strand:+ start:468 stop:731 length:264 start_codon:yes stop_codon:yes gene_type:complete